MENQPMSETNPQKTNPQIEAALEQLATSVCEALQGDSDDFRQRHEGLLKTLLMSGYQWKNKQTLMTDVEKRVKMQCGQIAMHRGGELSSMTIKLGERFQTLAREQSKAPRAKSSPKAANISSATDA